MGPRGAQTPIATFLLLSASHPADKARRLAGVRRLLRGDRRSRPHPRAGGWRHCRGRALDVFEDEPSVDPRLKALRNVVLLPHMSSVTIAARIDMGEKVIIHIKTFADGHKPPDRVIPAML